MALYVSIVTILKVKKAYSTLSKEQKDAGEGHPFSIDYHGWYNESLRLIKQLMPERLDDFVGFYSAPKNRKIINMANYTTSDCLLGYQASNYGKIIVEPIYGFTLFQQQLQIVLSLKGCFESLLHNVKEFLQAGIFDSELDSAKELHKNGFYRAAGAFVWCNFGETLFGSVRISCNKDKEGCVWYR